MLRISELKRPIRHHLGCDRAQPRARRARSVEQPHMRIESRKITAGVREKRHALDRNPQSGDCLLETTAEEQSGTDQVCLVSGPRARAEAQGQLSMLSRAIRLAGPQPEKAADVPAARETGIV